jgi:putative nucleotidyltransferase with HDIG domain
MNQEQAVSAAKVLDRAQRLPSLPSLVLEILESFDDERMDVSTLARKIANDQALVARVMRVANSAFFGLSGQIGTISEAISVLGFNNLRGLVTAASIINAMPKNLGQFDQVVFWRHGICAAVCAKVLARRVGLNPEIAFTAGVLHDIGKLVIVMEFPQMVAELRQNEEESDEASLLAERAKLGFDHAMLGGELASRWKFPPAIRDSISQHHDAQPTAGRGGLSDVIYVANLFAHALDHGSIREQKYAHLASELTARLMQGSDALPALAEEAQQLYSGSILLVGE